MLPGGFFANISPLAHMDNGRKKQFRVMFRMSSCTQMCSQSQEMVCAAVCPQIVLKSTEQFQQQQQYNRVGQHKTYIVYFIRFSNGK